MAKKRSSGKTTGQGLTISQAAKKVGVSQAGVRKWIKEEARLARCVSKKSGVARLSGQGVEVLAEIKKERFKNANRGLRNAWKKRSDDSSAKRPVARKKRGASEKVRKVAAKATSKATPKTKRKATAKAKAKATPKTSRKAPRRTRPRAGAKRKATLGTGLSGADAAKKLGVNKNLVYDLLKQFKIAKKSGPKQFTEDVMKQLRDALKKLRGKKSPKRKPSRPRKAAARKTKRKATRSRAASSVDTMTDGLGSAMKTIQAAVDATLREYHVKLDELRRFFEDQKDAIERGMKAVGFHDK